MTEWIKPGHAAMISGYTRQTIRQWALSGKLDYRLAPSGYMQVSRDHLVEILRKAEKAGEAGEGEK